MRMLPITPHEHQRNWNYTIAPTGPRGQSGQAITAVTAGDRDRSRAQALAMLADPKVTGMQAGSCTRCVPCWPPDQAALAEQRKHLQRGGPRRKARGRRAVRDLFGGGEVR
jgi:hypothetical protein